MDEMKNSDQNDLEPQLEEARCPICSISTFEPVLTSKSMDQLSMASFNVVKCEVCGLYITNPRPSPASMSRFYEGGFYETREKRWKQVLVNPVMKYLQALRLKQFAGIKKSGRLLDVGCGKGKFLVAAASRGWEAWGIEPSQRSNSFAEGEDSIKIYGGKFEEADLPDGFFDVITMWHTLEHFYDPLETLINVRKKLKPDGYLLIRVPNIDSWDFQIGGRRWFHLDVPRHLYHFSPATLDLLLHKAGFQTISTSTASLEDNPIGSLQTGMSIIGFQPGSLFHLIKTDKSAKNSRRLLTSLGILSASLLLTPPALLFSIAAQTANRGDVITVLAVRSDSGLDCPD